MSLLAISILALLFCAAATFASMLGIGGGFLFTPMQVLSGEDIHRAATTSNVMMMALSLSATLIYRKAKKVDWKTAAVFQIFLVSGAFIGGYTSKFIPAVPTTLILCTFLIAGGISMLFPARTRPHPENRHPLISWRRTTAGETYCINLLIALPLSFVAGLASGVLGIGGGLITVPMMSICFGVPIDIAIATSTFMVGLTAFGGASGHTLAGHLDWKTALILTPSALIGARIGAKLMLRSDRNKLKKIFAILLFIVAAALLAKTVASF